MKRTALIVVALLATLGGAMLATSASAQQPKPWIIVSGSDKLIQEVVRFNTGQLSVTTTAGKSALSCCNDRLSPSSPLTYTVLYGSGKAIDGVVQFESGEYLVLYADGTPEFLCCSSSCQQAQGGQGKATPTNPPGASVTPPQPTQVPTQVPPTKSPPPTPKPTEQPKAKCNNGVGNGSDCPPPGLVGDTQGLNDNDPTTLQCGTPGNPCNRKGTNRP